MLDFGFYNMDCMDGMREFPDNYFDLAIVDPPYGIVGAFSQRCRIAKYGQLDTVKDAKPSTDFFNELFRVSKNQIVWGTIIYLICCQLPKNLFSGINISLLRRILMESCMVIIYRDSKMF